MNEPEKFLESHHDECSWYHGEKCDCGYGELAAEIVRLRTAVDEARKVIHHYAQLPLLDTQAKAWEKAHPSK